jgi:ribosomal protein L1
MFQKGINYSGISDFIGLKFFDNKKLLMNLDAHIVTTQQKKNSEKSYIVKNIT